MSKIALVCVALCLTAAAASPADDRTPGSVLHLANGSFIPGELRASDDSKVLRWHSPFFADSFEFPLSAVNAVHYSTPGPPPKPAGEYCFELLDDDILYGNLVALSDDAVELEVPGIGRLHVRREHVRRFFPCRGADAIYAGPNGLADWKDRAASPLWRDEGGHLTADKPGATLFGEVGIPEQAVIEVELSWKSKPNFVLALGVDERDETNAFQLEVWDDELVVVGESARDADLATLEKLATGAGRASIQVYLDQKQGRLILAARGGKSPVTLNIKPRKAQTRPGVRLTNKTGDVRLERLRVMRWNGLAPREVRADQARVHRTDGSILYGQLAAYDPRTKQFTVRDGTTETFVKHDAIADLFLSPAQPAGKAANDPPAAGAQRSLRVVYRDGSRFSGVVSRIEDGHIVLNCPGVKEPLRLPRAELRALLGLGQGATPPAPTVHGRAGRLEMTDLRLQGRFVAGPSRPDASCLVWHPDLSLNASPLARGSSGRVVYREPPPSKPSLGEDQPVIRRGGDNRPNVGTAGRRSMHLRSGDTIPCEVTGMDEKGVTFKTPLSDTTFVPHEKIKSVELVWTTDAPGLDDPKRDRLLTLPRVQRGAPPTHLICSKNGDYLRGRVLEMDEARLKVEVRLETKEIPRNRVARIIWLHADELTDGKGTATPVGASQANRVQAVRADGNRLTFVAEAANHETISGTSDVLGQCRADLADMDQLLIGSFIEQSAARLAYGLWKLHHAVDPKFAQDDPAAPADDRSMGLESPLVGKPAFAFKLDLVGGGRFQLADRKGRVVVLEFWATWCGPCLQTMPHVEAVVREFAEQNVEFLAVNLEEPADQIKAVLERHKLKAPVAMDRDGVVAAKYAVTAIPQTVVIDRDGNVARLFVGGGKKTAEALRKAIQELSAAKPAPMW